MLIMAEHLLSNVYQVGGERLTHALDAASYLIVDEQYGRHVLVDCGSLRGHARLVSQLGSLGLKSEDVPVVYGTHCHYDHVSGVAGMDQTTLAIHPDDRGAIEHADQDLTASFLYDCSFPEITRITSVEDGYQTKIGSTLLTAIHTPGHTPGSMSYKLATTEGTILLAGDTLWGGCEKRINSDLDRWENSLDRLLCDRFDYLSFGHGPSRLVPRAMAHLALARSHFRVAIRPSHGGRYFNPWADPLTHAVPHAT